MPNYVSQCHGGPVRNEETVDRIFAGDLDGLPNLSSRVKTVMVIDFHFTYSQVDMNGRTSGKARALFSFILIDF